MLFRVIFFAGLLVFGSLASGNASDQTKRPNFLVIVVDDQYPSFRQIDGHDVLLGSNARSLQSNRKPEGRPPAFDAIATDLTAEQRRQSLA